MKSHMSAQQARDSGVAFRHWAGNAIADVFASVAADATKPDELVARFAESHAMQAFVISVRLAVIEAAHLRAGTATRVWTVLMASEACSWQHLSNRAKQNLQNSGHSLILRPDGKHTCIRCGVVRSKWSFGFWTDSSCRPGFAQKPTKPRRLPNISMQHSHGNHLLIWHSGAPTCLLCAHSGKLTDFPDVCAPFGADSPKRCQIRLEADLKGFKSYQQEQTLRQREVTKLDRVWDNVAVAALSQEITRTEAQPSNLPDWACKVDWSHQICYAGGLIMCRGCGSLAASNNLQSLLFQPQACRGEMPTGSASRLRRFLRGKLPYNASHWPCGIHAKFKLAVWRRMKTREEKPAVVRDTGEWEESEGAVRSRLGQSTPIVELKTEVLEYVTAKLDAALTTFNESDVLELPDLAGNPLDLSVAMFDYIARRFQDYWVDRLLERSFEVELKLGELADALKPSSH